jgi:hypothetical protein
MRAFNSCSRRSADRARGPAGCGGHLVAFLRAQDRADLLARSVTSSRAAVDLAEDIVPAEIKAEMRQRTNWGDLLAPAAYNPPASRQPQYAPGFRIGDHVWMEKLEPK